MGLDRWDTRSVDWSPNEGGWAITITLAMRPVGAFVFGLLGDRFGRRIPLMIDIVFYSLMELLTAFAPNFTMFLIFRGLYGIGMGGEWGLGASLAMESLPTEARGLFSGILQQGYAFGYLLAAVVYWLVFPFFGWRGLFVDNEGRAHAFVNGKISAGTAEFLGPNRGPNGEEVLNRIRVVRLSADKVEQTWDKSTDKGVTWSPIFRLEYSRKKS